ncbi:FUSC family protein [Larsenimonas rhizosphaerae]|uniref:FUSC family protein n=1 Tax=Larsenimonas rhizosphaerae TaxID=2944682 RepID=UPI0020339807|nr:FUSC family protein [Larsenimonas rhizosphaerae]MCM2129633.1 FUSC family protein [Larsenimonas rhizosphaerae]
MNAIWADRVLMALKTAIAVVITLYIAIRFGLVQPAWAILGVLLVTVQPMMFTGATPPVGVMVRRGIARLLGTVIGAVAGVVLIGFFGQQPLLYVLAAGAWLAVCTYGVMLLQDEPLSYTMMLCGYTATMVSLTAIGHDPVHVIDYAIGRTEETGLGIIVGLIINIAVMPRFGSDRLPQAITTFLREVARESTALLEQSADSNRLARYQALLQQQRQMDQTQGMARFEHWRYRLHRQPLARFASDSLALLSALADLEVALARLRLKPGGEALASDISARMQAWFMAWQRLDDTGRVSDDALSFPVLERDTSVPPPTQACMALVISRLQDISALMLHGQRLLSTLHTGRAPRELPRRARGTWLHLEHRVAAFNAFRVFAGFTALGLFWLHSGWLSGYFAMMMMAVFCVLFAKAPNPHRIVFHFFIGTAISVPVAMLYSFIIFPAISGFWLMAISLAVPVGLTALMLPYPALAASLPAIINLSMTLNLQQQFHFAPLALLNSSLASLVGTAAAVVVFLLFRQRPSHQRLQNLFGGFWDEFARLAGDSALPHRGRLEVRLHDRLGRMMALGSTADQLHMATTLHGLGLGVWRLRHLRRRMASSTEGVALDEFDHWLSRLGHTLYQEQEAHSGVDREASRQASHEAIDWARTFYHARPPWISMAAELEMLSHRLTALAGSDNTLSVEDDHAE